MEIKLQGDSQELPSVTESTRLIKKDAEKAKAYLARKDASDLEVVLGLRKPKRGED